MSGSLVEQVEIQAQRPRFQHVFVPLKGVGSAEALLGEMACIATEEGGDDLVVIVDSVTAATISSVAVARDAAATTVVFGPLPATWPGRDDLIPCLLSELPTSQDRFFVALSSTVSLALVFSQTHQAGDEPAFEAGGWTVLRGFVGHIAELLMAAGASEVPPGLLGELAAQSGSEDSSSALRLAGELARHHDFVKQEMIQASDDLSTVLDIVKSLFAKTSTRDILYIYVERIAAAIGIDRCSIVRVWGGEDKGHVMVSHDNKDVTDLVINLSKYPEIHRAMDTRTTVVINDIPKDRLTRAFAAEIGPSGITGILVVPILLFNETLGSFFLRAARKGGQFNEREVNFCEIVGEAAANALERAHLLESVQKANERLGLLAVTDGLTGLYNHRFFRERLEEEFDRAVRYKLPLSCLILDIDDFKTVNDDFGHLQGDVVLKEVASRTVRAVRKNDLMARYGGEEFVGILPQTNREGAIHQAKRLLKEISGAPYEGLPEDRKVTVSIGLAVLDQETMADSEALVREADSALYIAKEGGKDRIVVHGVEQL